MRIGTILMLVMVLAAGLAVAGCQDQKTIVIGAKPFNEQYILAEMVSLLLDEKGYSTEVKSGLNDATLFEGIKKGQVDVYVEYTGTAYSQLLKLPPLETWDPEVVFGDVTEGLAAENIVVLYRFGFRDDYAIAVREDWAEENGVATISDLVPHAPDLVFASDLVFHEREDGLPRLAEVYGLSFQDVKPLAPTLMYEAIANGQADAIPPYTTDTRVDLYNLRTLRDDKSALPPYHAMLLISRDLDADAVLAGALRVLENRIDTDTMRVLNRKFDIDKMEARDIAREYLAGEGLLAS